MFIHKRIFVTAFGACAAAAAHLASKQEDRNDTAPGDRPQARPPLAPPPAARSLTVEPTRNFVGRRALPAQDLRVSSRHLIRGGDFVVRRGLARYGAQLGDAFLSDLARLGPGDHYLDSGAGECVAVQDYLREVPEASRASVTAVTFFATQRPHQALAAASRAMLLDGRFFEDIPDAELVGAHGRFALITDVYGVLSYADDPGRVLRKYVGLLAEGGKLYAQLGVAADNVVTSADGAERTFLAWLAAQPGLDVRVRDHSFMLRVSDPARVQLPALELVALDRESRPPYVRRFRECPPRPKNAHAGPA